MPEITPQLCEELRNLAQKASPGPWIYDWNWQTLKNREGFQIAALRDIQGADAEYLEKFSPDLLLALLRELEILRAERKLLLKYTLDMGNCPAKAGYDGYSYGNECHSRNCRQCWSKALRRHVCERLPLGLEESHG